MGMGQVKNNRGTPVLEIVYNYNGTSSTIILEKNTEADTTSANVTHSNSFTHSWTETDYHIITYGSYSGSSTCPSCGKSTLQTRNAHCYPSGEYRGTDRQCTSCGYSDSSVTACPGYSVTKTATDCSANTSHGSLGYRISFINGVTQFIVNPTLSNATISGYSWTYTPSGETATEIGTTDTVEYQGLGEYTCTITFYDSNSGSSSSHNFTQSFSLEITSFKKKRK